MNVRVSRSLAERDGNTGDVIIQAGECKDAEIVCFSRAELPDILRLRPDLKIKFRRHRPSNRIAEVVDRSPPLGTILRAAAVERVENVDGDRFRYRALSIHVTIHRKSELADELRADDCAVT